PCGSSAWSSAMWLPRNRYGRVCAGNGRRKKKHGLRILPSLMTVSKPLYRRYWHLIVSSVQNCRDGSHSTGFPREARRGLLLQIRRFFYRPDVARTTGGGHPRAWRPRESRPGDGLLHVGNGAFYAASLSSTCRPLFRRDSLSCAVFVGRRDTPFHRRRPYTGICANRHDVSGDHLFIYGRLQVAGG